MKKHTCECCNRKRILAYTHNVKQDYSYDAICNECYNEFDEKLKKYFKPIKEIGVKNGFVCYFH